MPRTTHRALRWSSAPYLSEKRPTDSATSALPTKSTALLSSFGFVIALFLLLFNDLYLKSVAGGFVTGKLSDFAGLFVFPVFWTALRPRYRTLIHWVTAAAFVWWKLPVSAPFIDFWNAWVPLPIGRTEDWTDLVALSAVAGSYRFTSAPRLQIPLPALRWVTIPTALFSFGATTFLSVQQYDETFTYRFRTDPVELRRSFPRLGIENWVEADSTPATRPSESGLGPLNVRIPTGCCVSLGANLFVLEDTVGAAVNVLRLQLGGRYDRVALIDIFEQCFVQRLDSLLTEGAYIRPTTREVPRHQQWCAR